MSTALKPNLYRILLLTIWQEDEETWRFLLEDPRSGERMGFAGPESLVEGLQRVIDRNQAEVADAHIINDAPAVNDDSVVNSAQSPGC